MFDSNTALLVIDVQKGLDNPALGARSNPHAEQNIAGLLKQWRCHAYPVLHIKHNSTEPESLLRPELPGNAYKPEAEPMPGEMEFGKCVNSAFIGTRLQEHLQQQSIQTLVVVGLTVDHCVSTTVRMGSNLGFNVLLIADATAAFERTGYNGLHYPADVLHETTLVTLQDEFCSICRTQDVVNFLQSLE